MAWGSWAALVGGIISIVGQWTASNYYLALIGGIVAVIGAIGAMSE